MVDVWTEVITENIAATHVGDGCVLVEIGDATEYEVSSVHEEMLRRKVRRDFLEQARGLREDHVARSNARRLLEQHGIDDPPL